MSKTIKQWQEEIYAWAKSKGWWEQKDRNPLEIAALMHTEISEFVEDIRHGYEPRHYSYADYDNNVLDHKPIGPAIELADLAIRLLDYCEAVGIDLEKMIEIKMKYNETRPYRHGNKTA